MQKGLGISALVLAILAILIPFAGSWITVLVALLAAFAAGNGFGLGVAAIIINAFHIMLLSPLLWATQGLASLGAEHAGEEIIFIPYILLGIQAVALAVLIMFNKKSESASASVSTSAETISS